MRDIIKYVSSLQYFLQDLFPITLVFILLMCCATEMSTFKKGMWQCYTIFITYAINKATQNYMSYIYVHPYKSVCKYCALHTGQELR